MDTQTRLQQIIERINDHPFKAFIISLVILLFTTVIIVLAAIFLSYFTLLPFVFSINQNCTLVKITSFVNQNSSGFIGMFTNSMLTLGLIIFSALSLSSAHDALKQSQKQQKQFQNEQQIRDIEKRLELFYIPAQNTLKKAVEYLKNPKDPAKYAELIKYKRPNTLLRTTNEEFANMYAVEKLKEIEKYRFLAKEEACRSFIKFVYEEENSENRLELSVCVQTDVNDYLVRLYELKK